MPLAERLGRDPSWHWRAEFAAAEIAALVEEAGYCCAKTLLANGEPSSVTSQRRVVGVRGTLGGGGWPFALNTVLDRGLEVHTGTEDHDVDHDDDDDDNDDDDDDDEGVPEGDGKGEDEPFHRSVDLSSRDLDKGERGTHVGAGDKERKGGGGRGKGRREEEDIEMINNITPQ